jgi:exopolysaccharide biosynthesis polyprenyl glycosylphosphotransferase
MPETLYNPQLLIERVDLKEKGDEHSLIGSLPDLTTILHSKLEVEYFEGKLYYSIKRNPLANFSSIALKRLFDIVFSSLVIVFILSWLTPLIALLIKLDSKGPVFYKQKRSGKNNKVFYCLKFRTMTYVKNAEFRPATKNDCRVTKVGKFLRKTSLDEFAQFFNVFIGDMSAVGPRPHPLKLNDDFQHRVDKYMLRHVVKPGLTGLAQAKGYRGEVSDTLTMRQRIKVDIFYIENWSFLLDIKIVFLTAYNIFLGDKNAY